MMHYFVTWKVFVKVIYFVLEILKKPDMSPAFLIFFFENRLIRYNFFPLQFSGIDAHYRNLRSVKDDLFIP